MASARMSIMGTRHVISAGHYLAAHAGFQILEAGGNAIDAGVAAGIAIGVLQTDKVNFGGVAPQIIYTAKNRKVQLHRRPRRVAEGDHARLLPEEARRQDPAGRRALRGAGRARCVAHRARELRHDELRRSGVGGDPLRVRRLPDAPAHVASSSPKNRSIVPALAVEPQSVPAERPPAARPAKCSCSPISAGRCKFMADEERKVARKKGRKAGHQGRARRVLQRRHRARSHALHREGRRPDALRRFREFKVNFEPTVRTRFRGIELHACGPWSQGPVLPMALNILKNFDLKCDGAQLGRLHPRRDRGAQARVLRPPQLFRRSEVREGADQGPHVGRLREVAPLADQHREGVGGDAAGGRSADAARKSRTAGCPSRSPTKRRGRAIPRTCA